MKLKKILIGITMIMASAITFNAQAQEYKIHKYNSKDGGILSNITPNGKWAIVHLGTSAGGGTAVPQLYDVETEQLTPFAFNGRTIEARGISADANIVVGSMSGRAVIHNRSKNTLKAIPNRPLWQNADLTSITPDGKWAVGNYNGYTGKISDQDELNHDYYYSTLLVNAETGDTIATPGLPKRDMAGLDQHAIKFDEITPDGRYIIGQMSWYIMQPNSPTTFVYDTQTHTYNIVGFKENTDAPWTPLYEGLHHIEGPSMSPDGHWLTGMAYIAKDVAGSIFANEYGVPFRYDIQTGAFEVFDNTEINIDGCIIDNEGTIIANPNTGSPLRDFRILYQDKYWVSLTQICKQRFGFNFTEKTGYERTGTAYGISGDGSRLVSVVDPLSESYCIDFGKPIEEVCNGIDLLENYTVSPVNGSVFSTLTQIEINFGRNVQVLGKGNTHVHLYKEDGTKVADALSSGSGLALKNGSTSTVTAVFRTRLLEDGVKYYVVIDGGAIAVGNDKSRTNKEIRIEYTGRSNSEVKLTKVAPENHSKLRQIDAASSYILLTFDCPVKLTDNYSAYIERVDDGMRMATLTVGAGSMESTKNQILLYPASDTYLYEGIEYRVVLEEGSISDYAGSESSLNKKIELTYHGTFIREVSNDEIIFADSWDNISESLQTWLRYEGDHKTPLASMQNFEFDADNQPWNFSLRDNNESPNYYAASHSLYSPSGQSDDWMLTPQLLMPKEGKTMLEFDAQNYRANKKDILKVYVFEEEFKIPHLNDEWMKDIRTQAELLDAIELTPGENEETTEGDWTHYTYDLSKWANKYIYIAFVNQNNNQSMIFLDNVKVQREILYTIGFTNVERVVAKDDIDIAGQFTVKTSQNVSNISLTLKDNKGKEISYVEWTSLTENMKDKALPFSFSKPLPLTIGETNNYTITVKLDDRVEEFKGSILDLAFEPTKRVVLEEMTGIDCPNCPLGILTIEKCEKAFGDRFIPISLHTYTNDPYASSMGDYTKYLGLSSAPSARINRREGIYFPMSSESGTYVDTNPDKPLWFDIITQELNHLATADINVKAVLGEDGKSITYKSDIKYALNATNQQLALFIMVLENGLVNWQANNLGSLNYEILGEWAAGGKNSGAYAYPVTHNDIARKIIGDTFGGTLGLYPSTLEAGKTYSATFTSAFPETVTNAENAAVVAMLIDSQTGLVINAAKAPLNPYDKEFFTGIKEINDATQNSDIHTVTGTLIKKSASQSDINSLQRGIYIINGKKIIVR